MGGVVPYSLSLRLSVVIKLRLPQSVGKGAFNQHHQHQFPSTASCTLPTSQLRAPPVVYGPCLHVSLQVRGCMIYENGIILAIVGYSDLEPGEQC